MGVCCACSTTYLLVATAVHLLTKGAHAVPMARCVQPHKTVICILGDEYCRLAPQEPPGTVVPQGLAGLDRGIEDTHIPSMLGWRSPPVLVSAFLACTPPYGVKFRRCLQPLMGVMYPPPPRARGLPSPSVMHQRFAQTHAGLPPKYAFEKPSLPMHRLPPRTDHVGSVEGPAAAACVWQRFGGHGMRETGQMPCNPEYDTCLRGTKQWFVER